jgi:hypothetical protein
LAITDKLIDHNDTIHIKLARGEKIKNTILRLAVVKYTNMFSKDIIKKCHTTPTTFPARSNMILRLMAPCKGNNKKTKRKLKKQMETKAVVSSAPINSKHPNNVAKETINPTKTCLELGPWFWLSNRT